MKKDIIVRATNNYTGEVWEKTFYDCRSKYQADRKMVRFLHRLRRHYGVNFHRVEMWEASND